MANDHMYRGMVLSRAVEFRGRGGKRGRDWREGEENWEEGAENWEEEGKAGKGKGKKKARWGRKDQKEGQEEGLGRAGRGRKGMDGDEGFYLANVP